MDILEVSQPPGFYDYLRLEELTESRTYLYEREWDAGLARIWWDRIALASEHSKIEMRTSTDPLGTDDITYSVGCSQRSSTTNEASSVLPVVLEKAAEAGAHEVFKTLASSMTWSCYPPEQLVRAAELAMSLGLFTLATELVTKGLHTFPTDERIAGAAKLYGRPTVRKVHRAPTTNLEPSMRWLQEHAREYRGQWVLISNGKLLAAASQLKRLDSAIKEAPQGALLHYVPSNNEHSELFD